MRRSTRGHRLGCAGDDFGAVRARSKRARVASTAGPLTASVRGPQWATDVQSVGASGGSLGAVGIGTDVFHVGDTVIVRFDGADTTVARIEALWEEAREPSSSTAGTTNPSGVWRYSGATLVGSSRVRTSTRI